MYKLYLAAAGRILSHTDELSNKDLSESKLIEERKIENNEWILLMVVKIKNLYLYQLEMVNNVFFMQRNGQYMNASMKIKDVVEQM